MNDKILEETYLPFTEAQLRNHFSNVEYLLSLKESIKRYKEFINKGFSKTRLSINRCKIPCQIEKDERFWTITALLTLYYSEDRVRQFSNLFRKIYGKEVPIKGFNSWEQCFEGRIHILFECHLPPPVKYSKDWLYANIEKVQFIPYILNVSKQKKRNLEGATVCDAIIVNEENGFSVIVESKVLSDISASTTFNSIRNQLARIIDVMLEKSYSNNILYKREPDRTLFLLITPKLFKDNPCSRFYGYKFLDYKENPEKIAMDLPHRANDKLNWFEISKRLGWATWEDFKDINPECCKWLK